MILITIFFVNIILYPIEQYNFGILLVILDDLFYCLKQSTRVSLICINIKDREHLKKVFSCFFWKDIDDAIILSSIQELKSSNVEILKNHPLKY